MDAKSPKLEARPITLKDARSFVTRLHRHHKGSSAWRWGVAAILNGEVVGVAMCGRPNAQKLEQYSQVEVLRLCTDGTPNACSFLYGACRRIARAFGYGKVITYTLASEPGVSLRAAGFVAVKRTRDGDSWDKPGRPRRTDSPTEAKVRWEVVLK